MLLKLTRCTRHLPPQVMGAARRLRTTELPERYILWTNWAAFPSCREIQGSIFHGSSLMLESVFGDAAGSEWSILLQVTPCPIPISKTDKLIDSPSWILEVSILCSVISFLGWVFACSYLTKTLRSVARCLVALPTQSLTWLPHKPCLPNETCLLLSSSNY